MDWSHDGKLFVTEGTEDTGIVDIRDAVTGETVQEFRGDTIDINDVVFSADSKRVVTASDEGAIRVWDIATGRKLGDVTVGSEGPAWGPSISPDGRLVAGAWPEHNKVRVFPAVGGKPWVIHAEYAQDTAFSPDGRRLAVAAGGSGTVHVVDLETRREVLVLDRNEGILDLDWSPDGRWLAASGNSGASVYDARTGRLRPVTPAPHRPASTPSHGARTPTCLPRPAKTAPRASSSSRERGSGGRPAGRPGHAQRRPLRRVLAGRPRADDQ